MEHSQEVGSKLKVLAVILIKSFVYIGILRNKVGFYFNPLKIPTKQTFELKKNIFGGLKVFKGEWASLSGLIPKLSLIFKFDEEFTNVFKI